MIAIIPARSGSKGVPRKNVKMFLKKPLIVHTIEAALSADCVDRVVVSTDDEEIIKISKENGADVPFVRPADLASDKSSAIDVYLHAIDYLSNEYKSGIEKFMVLLPTVPFRTKSHIDEAYSLFVRKKANTLISVTNSLIPPSWYMEVDADGHLFNCGFGTNMGFVKNRQMDSGYLIPNGAIYILDYQLLKTKRTYYCDNTIPYIMKREDSIDIDTVDDWEYAVFVAERRISKWQKR